MNRPGKSTVVRAVVALVVAVGALVVVREVFFCFPLDDQADMIERYEADPLLAVVPDNSQLVSEYAHTYSCDSGMPHGGSPTGPGFAEVMRQYRTPAALSSDQLRHLFDQPAAAAGWRPVRLAADMPDRFIAYCKQAGGRASRAQVWSGEHAAYLGDGPAGPGVEIVVSAAGAGSRCDFDMGGGASASPDN